MNTVFVMWLFYRKIHMVYMHMSLYSLIPRLPKEEMWPGYETTAPSG